MVFLCAPQLVAAQTEEVAVDASVAADDSAVGLEGIEIVDPAEKPSGFGLLFRDIRERVSLVLTFDAVEKAEKQVKFAEERLKIAEKIAAESSDPAAQARALKVVERAERFLNNVAERSEAWAEKRDDRVNRLMKNIATHQANRWTVIEKLEEEFGEAPRLDRLREKAEAGQGLLNAIDNENIPPEVREHLQNVKARIDASAKIKMELKERKQDLLDRAKSGDASVKEELKKLQEERKEKLEGVRENFKLKQEQSRERKSAAPATNAGGDVKERIKIETRKEIR